MSYNTIFRMSGDQHRAIKRHLFPGDSKEAVALLLCGRGRVDNLEVLSVYEILPVPYNACTLRSKLNVQWPTNYGHGLFEKASQKGMGIVKIHSHPGGYREFSEADDESDGALFPSLHGWTDDERPHASAVMLPDGEIFARSVDKDGKFTPVVKVVIAGDDIKVYTTHGRPDLDVQQRTGQAFGPKTVATMSALHVGVVGCSGILRHSYASYALGRDKNRTELAEHMGNTAEVIARRYRRALPGTEIAAFWKLSPPRNWGKDGAVLVR